MNIIDLTEDDDEEKHEVTGERNISSAPSNSSKNNDKPIVPSNTFLRSIEKLNENIKTNSTVSPFEPAPFSSSEPNTDSIFKVVVPAGKWGAKLMIHSYSVSKVSKIVSIGFLPPSSIVSGFICEGDYILEIDDDVTFGLSQTEIQGIIKKKENEPKSLLIQRFHCNPDILLPLVIPCLIKELPSILIHSLIF